MTQIFSKACESLGIVPIWQSLGVRSSASFASETDASLLFVALKAANAERVSIYHWDPKKDPDFEADEFQVDWGPID